MDGVVLELQKDSLNPNIDVVTLSRKAFVIAKKLKLSDFENWISKELNGYSLDDECPEYRHYTGQLKAWNPYHGWVPVLVSVKDTYEKLCQQQLRNPISNLLSFLGKESTLHVPYNDSVNTMLNSITTVPIPTRYALFIGNNIVDTIIESVKTRILEWGLLLEENGIIGEGLTFSINEKNAAVNNPIITNYINNFERDVIGSQIQQGASDSYQETQ